MKTLVLPQTGEQTAAIAAKIIRDGGLVALPTETVYGLGANALSDADFLAQFLNKAGSFAIGAPGADAFSGATGTETTGEETYVDAIAGATVTSKAVARCVKSAVGYVTGADVESSATCGFGYGILKAVHTGLIDASYADAAWKALEPILGYIAEDGVVHQVSYGTPMGRESKDFYKNIELRQMPYGQALAMLFLAQCLE